MPAYVIYQGEVFDPVGYDAYKAAAATQVAAAGGRDLVRGGECHVLFEGELLAPWTVILEFDDVDAARSWYEGDGYQEIKKLREGIAAVSMYVVEGLS